MRQQDLALLRYAHRMKKFSLFPYCDQCDQLLPHSDALVYTNRHNLPPEEAVKLSLDWEETVTKQINGLVDLAGKENDHTSHTFLQWFVNEQLEEVSSMDMLLKHVRRAGENLLFVEDYLARKGLRPAAGTAE